MGRKKVNEEEEDVRNGWFYAGIATIICALAVPIAIIRFSKTTINTTDIGLLGPVGDFFGGSTIGLLSIASIFFIIHTIRIQSKELALQRKELKLTRTELEDTRKVHEESNKTQLIQRFETTFFNMLSLHNDILANINRTSSTSKDRSGRNAISYIFNKYNLIYNAFKNLEVTHLQKIEMTTADFLKYYGDDIGHYYRNLYQILNFIDNSSLTHEEKISYVEILKAQFSLSELKLLFYYSIIMNDQNLQDFIIKYEIFGEYLKPSDLIDPGHYELLEY